MREKELLMIEIIRKKVYDQSVGLLGIAFLVSSFGFIFINKASAIIFFLMGTLIGVMAIGFSKENKKIVARVNDKKC